VERGNAFGLILHHGSLTSSGFFVRLRSQRRTAKQSGRWWFLTNQHFGT
jgi:hypothetical protein